MAGSNRRRRFTTTALAGWLFADLLVAMTVIFMASTGGVQARHVRPTATATPKPKTKPTPVPTARPLGIRRKADVWYLPVNSDAIIARNPAEIHRVDGLIARHFAAAARTRRRAGLVLSFGIIPLNTPPLLADRGNLAAERVNTELSTTLHRVFGGAVMRGYHDLTDSNAGTVRIEVYWFYQ
jgi:hypothetical protein